MRNKGTASTKRTVAGSYEMKINNWLLIFNLSLVILRNLMHSLSVKALCYISIYAQFYHLALYSFRLNDHSFRGNNCLELLANPEQRALSSITFAGVKFYDPISTNLRKLGILHPTPIQKAAIGPLTSGVSAIIHSQTGSGR